MQTLLRNRGLIFKTFLYQIVMSFFGVMMFSVTSQNQVLLIIGTASVILFYLYIMFYQSMQAGSKDCEYSIAHKEKTSPWWGLLPILLGFVPMIVLSVWSALSLPYNADGSYHNMIPFTIDKIFQVGMYQGVWHAFYPTSSGVDQAGKIISDVALGSINAAALNAQAALYPFAFLPGWLLGSAGYLFGWFRFLSDKKK